MNKKFTKIQTKMKQEGKWQPAFHKVSGIEEDILKLFTARE